MLRAVLVGFILGFALVGVFRVAAPADQGPQLTSGHLLHPGAAVDHVARDHEAGRGCKDGLQRLILV